MGLIKEKISEIAPLNNIFTIETFKTDTNKNRGNESMKEVYKTYFSVIFEKIVYKSVKPINHDLKNCLRRRKILA